MTGTAMVWRSLAILACTFAPSVAAAADPTPSAEVSGAAPATEAPTDEIPRKFNRWSIVVAPGADFILAGQWTAYGPSARIGAWVHAWRGRFMIGGGPSGHYSYLLDGTNNGDRIHFFTVNGDMVIGGGKPDKIAGYAHLTLGAGVLAGKDGQTGTTFVFPGVRAGAGGGVHGFVHRMLSLGALVDFGYLGGLGIDMFVTVGIHFKRKPK